MSSTMSSVSPVAVAAVSDIDGLPRIGAAPRLGGAPEPVARRQEEAEHGAFAGRAAHVDAAAEQPGETGREGKPETGSAEAPGDRCLGLREEPEQSVAMLL